MHINYSTTIKVVGLLTLIEGIFMIPAIIAGAVFREHDATQSMIMISFLCIITGLVTTHQLKFKKLKLKIHEGFFIAAFSWIYCSLIGALPYYLSGMDVTFIGCFFESVAGFTTTGAHIYEADMMPNTLVLWKSICQWLGGMGILVLVLSLFPLLGISGHSLAKTEAPGPIFEKWGSKSSHTGLYLYAIYIILTVLEFIFLILGPLDPFHAVTTTLSSISTSGIPYTENTAAAFEDIYTRMVILIFTFLSSINFVCYFLLAKKKWYDLFHNSEFKYYVKLILCGTIAVALCLHFSGTYSSLWQAVKDSLCQVMSIISTSGYYVCDYTNWPSFTHAVFFILMIIGGCSGSTSGSLKVVRFVGMAKNCGRSIFRKVHPNAVRPVILDDKPLTTAVASAITVHVLLYFGVFFVSAILLSFNNFDMETTFTSALSIFSNTGASFGLVGEHGDYSMFNGFSQLVMSILMITGRLEMYAVILLLSGNFIHPDKVSSF